MIKIEQPQIDMEKLIQELEIGKKSSQILKTLIHQNHPRVKLEVSNCNNNNNNMNNNQDFCKLLDHHSMVVLDAFLNSISMLQTHDFNAQKRKHEEHDHDDVISLVNNHSCKSEVSANIINQQHSPQMSFVDNSTRECYKKRKIGDESREEVVTHWKDDGFAWRKYGQKTILHSDYPRHYYRCTHKNEQNCEATKQIQQISQNPIKYKIKYNGNHTCNNNNILTTSPYMIDSSKEQHSSAFVLSFDGSNPVNPSLFPPSGISNSYNPSVSNPVVEQSEEISTGIGEDYSSHSTPISSDNLEEDYSFIMADFSELVPDFWTF